jgi:hypothetical protein
MSAGDVYIIYGKYLNLDKEGQLVMMAVIDQMLKNAEMRAAK